MPNLLETRSGELPKLHGGVGTADLDLFIGGGPLSIKIESETVSRFISKVHLQSIERVNETLLMKL
jgi:hypothetical protein